MKGNQETLHDDGEEYCKDLDFEHPEPEVHQDFDLGGQSGGNTG